MPPVNINVTDAANAALNVNVNPSKVAVGGRVGLNIQWNLNAGGSGWDWDTNGITVDTNPPAPYSPWTTPQPTLVGGVYQATAPALPVGGQPQLYKYNVKLRKGTGLGRIAIDPDIGNDPPSGGQDGGGDGDHGGDDHGSH